MEFHIKDAAGNPVDLAGHTFRLTWGVNEFQVPCRVDALIGLVEFDPFVALPADKEIHWNLQQHGDDGSVRTLHHGTIPPVLKRDDVEMESPNLKTQLDILLTDITLTVVDDSLLRSRITNFVQGLCEEIDQLKAKCNRLAEEPNLNRALGDATDALNKFGSRIKP